MKYIVENGVQTTINLISVCNKILKNTEMYHVNFIKYGISVKPPFEGSHLVYNTDNNHYQYWAPTKKELENLDVTDLFNFKYNYRTCVKQNQWIFFPLGHPYVVLLEDTSWINDFYQAFSFKPEHIQPLSERYGGELYKYIQSHATIEREGLKRVLSDLERTNLKTQSKNLF